MVECWSGSMLSGTQLLYTAKHGTFLTLIAPVVQWEPGNAWEADDKLCNAHMMVVVNRVLLLSTWHVQPSFKLNVQFLTVF